MSTKFTLAELKVRIDKAPFEEKGKRKSKRRFFDKQLKLDILEFHYTTGRTMDSLSRELNIIPQVINKWKRVYGNQRTAVIHGKGIRNDVRTKALAVQTYIDGTMSAYNISVKYGVAQQTVHLWIRQYKDKYLEYIDLPDGVTVIAKEEKHVYGNKNIAEVEQLLAENHKKLVELINSQHFSDSEIKALKKMKEKSEKEQKDIQNIKNTAKKLNIKL